MKMLFQDTFHPNNSSMPHFCSLLNLFAPLSLYCQTEKSAPVGETLKMNGLKVTGKEN